MEQRNAKTIEGRTAQERRWNGRRELEYRRRFLPVRS